MKGKVQNQISKSYHHGNLRDQLVESSRQLIASDGSDRFKVADACRHAGVSTAAPYRHFTDRQALLDAVSVAGFNDLRDHARAAGGHHKKGSVEAVSAIGKAYVQFARSEPNLFRLMFSQSPPDHAAEKEDVQANDVKKEEARATDCEIAGLETYEVLLEQLAVTLGRDEIDEQVIEAAFPLWTFVHGLSFLLIDDNLSVHHAAVDIDRQVDRATARLMPFDVRQNQ